MKRKLYKGLIITFVLFNVTFAIIGGLVMLFGERVT
jgi:hypothetical protein